LRHSADGCRRRERANEMTHSIDFTSVTGRLPSLNRTRGRKSCGTYIPRLRLFVDKYIYKHENLILKCQLKKIQFVAIIIKVLRPITGLINFKLNWVVDVTIKGQVSCSLNLYSHFTMHKEV
jgi:hypothetical protein